MSAARDKVIGSTIRNTAEMLRMETGKRRINSADVAPVAPVAPVVPVVRVALVVPEDPVVQVASVVLENPVEPVALVVPENPVAPVVPAARVLSESPAVPVALERGQAVAELQHAPVVAVPLLGHRHVQQAIPLRTKSVTAAHRPDLVPLLEAEEDLAAVAETTREPAAAEAVTAWAAAE